MSEQPRYLIDAYGGTGVHRILPDGTTEPLPKAITWHATPELRWRKRKVMDEISSDATMRIAMEVVRPILQQRWVSSDGQTEWRDVPTENNSDKP